MADGVSMGAAGAVATADRDRGGAASAFPFSIGTGALVGSTTVVPGCARACSASATEVFGTIASSTAGTGGLLHRPPYGGREAHWGSIAPVRLLPVTWSVPLARTSVSSPSSWFFESVAAALSAISPVVVTEAMAVPGWVLRRGPVARRSAVAEAGMTARPVTGRVGNRGGSCSVGGSTTDAGGSSDGEGDGDDNSGCVRIGGPA